MAENAVAELRNFGGVSEENFDSAEVLEAMRTDLNFHAAVCMPEDATCEYPDLFKELWDIVVPTFVKVRDFSKFAIGLPRGMGKTMWIKLLVCWAIFFSDRRFILVVCASDNLAENIIADISDILDSENIRELFGNWRANIEIDRKDFKKFTFGGKPRILKAVGRNTAVRGITVKNKRPDIIIGDDTQTKECAESVTEALKFARWFRGTLMKAKNPFSCTYLYVGNMYPDMLLPNGQYTCMLRNLQKSPHWTSIILGAITSDGNALWEEVQPLSQLLEEFQQDMEAGTPEVFYAEVMNDPQGGGNANIDTTKVRVIAPEETEICVGKFLVIDPANDKKNSDDTAIGAFSVYNATPHLDEIFAEKADGPTLVRRALEIASERGISAVFVEAHAYQYSLLGWFNFICEQLGLIDIAIYPIYTHGISKNTRILSMLREAVQGNITFSKEAWPLVLSQIHAFDRLRKNNTDDILDVCAYGVQVMLENEADIRSPLVGEYYGVESGAKAQAQFGMVQRKFDNFTL